MGKYVSSNSIFYKVTVLAVMKVQQKPSIFPYILQKKNQIDLTTTYLWYHFWFLGNKF